MFTSLLQTQKAAATGVIFVGTFFLALTIGRFLKRREGVRLGIFYQLFCLTIATYAAIAFYGIRADFRIHLIAGLTLLGTVFIAALVNRYLWDAYYERRRRTPIPKLLRELFALLLFILALLFVLHFLYHAEAGLKGVFATSSLFAVVLGFAAQNLFGGIIAGVALQIGQPYKVGDWLQIGDRLGEVMEVNWRSTRLRTNDAISLDIPNNEIVRQTIVNLHHPTPVHAMRLRVAAEYRTPPNQVKDALLRAASAEGVLPEPQPKIYLADFAESAVIYEIKFWMGNHALYNDVTDAIRTNVWYEFKRERIRIPFPARTVHVERKAKDAPVHEGHEEARAILRREPLFSCLSDARIDMLLTDAELDHFGRGERIIEEGAAGASMFILLHGTAQVSVDKDGAAVPVGMLRAGDCFGEMSLLTGDPRTATVRAEGDCYVLEIKKAIMAHVVKEFPECLDQLSELLGKRKLENEGILRDAAGSETDGKQREYSATFLTRLRTFFEL